MTCEEFREKVYDLAAGELTEKEARVLRSHMGSCSRCRSEYEECEAIIKSLSELGEETAPLDLSVNVMSAIAREKAHRRYRIIKFAASAAAAVVLVAGVVKVMPGLHTTEIPKKTNDAADTVLTDAENENIKAAAFDQGMTVTDDAPVYTGGDNSQTDSAVNVPEKALTQPQPVETSKPQREQTAQPELTEKTAEKSRSALEPPKESLPETAVGEKAQPNNSMAVASVQSESAEDAADTETGTLSDNAVTFGLEPYSVGAKAVNGSETYAETEERQYICRKSEFAVSGEYAYLADEVNTEGKTMEQVSDELDALGVEYEVYVVEDDYTEEYKNASDQRKAEIEALCSMETCIITK